MNDYPYILEKKLLNFKNINWMQLHEHDHVYFEFLHFIVQHLKELLILGDFFLALL